MPALRSERCAFEGRCGGAPLSPFASHRQEVGDPLHAARMCRLANIQVPSAKKITVRIVIATIS